VSGRRCYQAAGNAGPRHLAQLPPACRPSRLQTDGAAALAQGLAVNRTLQMLALPWNGLESEGVAALGQSLAANEGLKCLDLAHTRWSGLGRRLAVMAAGGSSWLCWQLAAGSSLFWRLPAAPAAGCLPDRDA
jgi:hypothetical protein